MAKDTRLGDEAQIYQPRDTRTERQKFKDMNKKERIQYFKDYYLAKTIVGVGLIAFAIYFLYTIFGPKEEIVLYTAILDGCIQPEVLETMEGDLSELWGLTKGKEKVVFDDTFFSSGSSDFAISSAQKLIAYTSTGEIDVIIGTEETMNNYAYSEYFLNLADYLPKDLYDSFVDNFFFSTTESSPQDCPYGIYLDDFAIKDGNGNVLVRPILAILVNAESPEHILDFIQYLNDVKN